MPIRKTISTLWDSLAHEWLTERLVPYVQRYQEQERRYQELLRRCEELEEKLREQQEAEDARSLWQEIIEDDIGEVVRVSSVYIHSEICLKEGCLEPRFRKDRCLLHYEHYVREEQFDRGGRA